MIGSPESIATMIIPSPATRPPLGPSARRVAVIGPNADVVETGGGGSSQVVPHRILSFVDELRARLDDVDVVYEAGCRLDRGVPLIDARLPLLRPRFAYFPHPALAGPPAGPSGEAGLATCARTRDGSDYTAADVINYLVPAGSPVVSSLSTLTPAASH